MAEVMPLEVLLTMMRRHWGEKEFDEAVALAKIAAPYLHGKAAIARPSGTIAEVSDEELESYGREG